MSLRADVEPAEPSSSCTPSCSRRRRVASSLPVLKAAQDGLLSLGAGESQHRTLAHPVVDISLAQGGALLAHVA